MTEHIITNHYYRVCTDAVNDIWNRYSFWSKADDVELNSGQMLQPFLDELELTLTQFQTKVNQMMVDGDDIHNELTKGLSDLAADLEARLGNLIERLNSIVLTDGSADGYILLTDRINELNQELTEKIEYLKQLLASLPTEQLPEDFGQDDGELPAQDDSEYNTIRIEIQALRDDLEERLRRLYDLYGDKNIYPLSADGSVTAALLNHQYRIEELEELLINSLEQPQTERVENMCTMVASDLVDVTTAGYFVPQIRLVQLMMETKIVDAEETTGFEVAGATTKKIAQIDYEEHYPITDLTLYDAAKPGTGILVKIGKDGSISLYNPGTETVVTPVYFFVQYIAQTIVEEEI